MADLYTVSRCDGCSWCRGCERHKATNEDLLQHPAVVEALAQAQAEARRLQTRAKDKERAAAELVDGIARQRDEVVRERDAWRAKAVARALAAAAYEQVKQERDEARASLDSLDQRYYLLAARLIEAEAEAAQMEAERDRLRDVLEWTNAHCPEVCGQKCDEARLAVADVIRRVEKRDPGLADILRESAAHLRQPAPEEATC